ncbi:B3/B4 domain-containing protein [Flindersiella endophytica]
MRFQHSSDIWRDYPELAAGALFADGIHPQASVDGRLGTYYATADARLADAGSESQLPEIQAWRRAFARMGLKPTQYRCASESLLRRYKKERELPRLHPLVDLCNAISLAFAIPVAVLDVGKLTGVIEVRYAHGDEAYETFQGELEHPEQNEVIFADDANRAHARRWTNRQSGHSAVRAETGSVLIVAEAMHETGDADLPKLIETIADELAACWSIRPAGTILTPAQPSFEFPG